MVKPEVQVIIPDLLSGMKKNLKLKYKVDQQTINLL